MRDLYRGDGGPLSSYDEGWNDGVEAAMKALSAENAAFRAEVEKCQEYMRTQFADRKDAERYRWLRDDDRGTALATAALWGKHPYTADERSKGIDAAIDAARKEAK